MNTYLGVTMKKITKIVISVLIFVLVVFALNACNRELEIETGNIKFENGAYTIYLSSDNSKVDVSSYFSVPDGEEYEISDTENFSNIVSEIAELKNGENKFYVRIVGSDKVYVFNFIKKNAFVVKYVFADGEEYSTITCEEGSLLEAPTPTKQGYSVVWDYDFTQAVNSDVTITGSWTPNRYSITVSAPGCEIDNQVIEVVFNESFTIDTPSLNGYRFTGWTYNGAKFDANGKYLLASDVTIKANFQAEEYTINYFLKGGIKDETNWPISFTVESDDIILPEPSWPNNSYVFVGWFADQELTQKITKISKGTFGDVDVYAKWESVKITTNVTISAPDLSFDNEKFTFTFGEAYDLSSFVKDGYTLSNWNDGTNSVASKGIWDIKAENITLTPVFVVNNYKIEYHLNGGNNNSNNPNTYTVNDEVVFEDPTWSDDTYIFDGWYIDEEFNTKIVFIQTGSTKNVTVYAKWIANVEAKEEITKVTLSADGFDCDGEIFDFTFGEEYSLPTLSKNGYKFNGWKTEDGTKSVPATGLWNIESEEITLVPNFEIITFKIEYVLNGGVNSNNNLGTFTVLDEIVFETPIAINSSYEFDGWYSDEECTTEITGIAAGTYGDIKVYAKWSKYTMVHISATGFDCDGTTLKLKFGEEFTLPSVQKDGYKLNGWKYEDEIIPNDLEKWLIDEAEITISPVWEARNYSITYILNGGVNTNEKVTFTIEDTIVLLDPTSDIAVFKGWYLDEQFTQKIEKIENMSANVVVYACWEYEIYTVTLDPGSGGNVSNNQVTVNYGVINTLPTPVMDGYAFKGWYYNQQLVNEAEPWLIRENVSLTAKWEIINYKIEYDLDGGTKSTGNWRETYTINTGNFSLPIPNKSGYKFLGWSLEDGPISYSMIVYKGSYGDRKYIAHWCDERDSSGFMYNLHDEDMTATVVGFNGEYKDVTIPAEFNGYKVTAIGEGAFNGLGKNLTSSSTSFVTFYLPETINRIGKDAFNDCDDLKVQLVGNKEDAEIQTWIDTVTIESGNKHVADVILNKRPAIGWKIYFKP